MAMIKKHTPGPWVAGRPDMATIVDGVRSKWIYGGDKDASKYVAVASGMASEDWSEVMANARLIAAAPEMLDALEALFSAACEVDLVADEHKALQDAIDVAGALLGRIEEDNNS